MERFKQVIRNVHRRRVININNLDTELNRCLNTFDLTMVGVSYTLGIGLYVLIGTVANTMAGPGVILSIIITAICALFSALCYAEFGCRVPKAGSAYLYAYVTVGEIWALAIGWNMILEYMGCVAGVSSGFAGAIDDTFDGVIYNLTVDNLMGGHPWTSPYFVKYPDIIAGLLVLTISVVLLFGVDISSKLNNILVFSLVIVLLLLIGYCLKFANISNWTDYGGFFPFGLVGVCEGAAQMFFLFAGFEVICISSEECKNPIKSLPIALILTIVVNAIFGVISAVCLTLMVPWTEIDIKSPFPQAFRKFHEIVPTYLVTIGTIITISGTILNALHGLSRLIYSIASDGLLFPLFARLSENLVPAITIVIVGITSCILAVFLSFRTLVQLLNIGSIVSYLIIAILLIVIRYRPVEENAIFYREEEKKENVQTDSVVGGTLKAQFKFLKFLQSEIPGRVVVASLTMYVICSGCFLFLIFHSDRSLGVLHLVFLVGAFLGFCVILLHNQNEEEPPFKVPFVPLVPAISIVCNMMLLANLSGLTWIRFVGWVAIGMVIYVAYGYSHSTVGRMNEEEAEALNPYSCNYDTEEITEFGTIPLDCLSLETQK
ncbi:cationic amino acid transporter 4-like [Anneissia japonica]|uniref:cationic amino acid transporter 4-like n=1 Tax=Anneissia japonica TaxID=1529436 RepID=UPI0014255606|nr:cationic amino acid transporter 4-like [Anneissia japonica]